MRRSLNQLAMVCTVPSGHTQPQKTRPRTKVASTVTSARSDATAKVRAASAVASAMSGSKSKNRRNARGGDPVSAKGAASTSPTKSNRKTAWLARRNHNIHERGRFSFTLLQSP